MLVSGRSATIALMRGSWATIESTVPTRLLRSERSSGPGALLYWINTLAVGALYPIRSGDNFALLAAANPAGAAISKHKKTTTNFLITFSPPAGTQPLATLRGSRQERCSRGSKGKL